VKAVLEEVLEEEMDEHLKAGYRELTPTRRGELIAATTSAT
jgi:transposase-like protein